MTDEELGQIQRPRRGRPSFPSGEKTKRRSVYLTESQWDHCTRLFKSQKIDASEYVRRLVELDMKNSDEIASIEVEPAPLRFVEPGPIIK